MNIMNEEENINDVVIKMVYLRCRECKTKFWVTDVSCDDLCFACKDFHKIHDTVKI